ncbi:histone H3 [Acanthamoeba castellanii medusavirus]|uniref:Histone H3 n=2 Tax=Mamonoviridae TaxID=3044469 RepID=A0A3T1CX62_9VIRU|nr:histone H3 [Acanthamoeba castellanii medusavirus]BBI30395.1 histone H3 [Acanthamoeba castellanii medusavirus J1]
MPKERAIKKSKSAVKKVAEKKAAIKSKAKKAATGVKKPHRFRPGTTAKRLSKKEQKLSSTKTTVRRAPFGRIVRTIASLSSADSMRFSANAVDLLQQGIELYMLDLMKNAALAAKQAKRMTLMGKDIDLIQTANHEMIDEAHAAKLANTSSAGFARRRVTKKE